MSQLLTYSLDVLNPLALDHAGLYSLAVSLQSVYSVGIEGTSVPVATDERGVVTETDQKRFNFKANPFKNKYVTVRILKIG